MVTKNIMEYLLDTANGLGPICIPSYKRWDMEKNKTLQLIKECDKDIQQSTFVFVRQNQYDKYKENFDFVNIVPLPLEIQGLAGTREYICWYVVNVLKQEIFMDIDDDIKYITWMFLNEQGTSTLHSTSKSHRVSESIRLGFNLAQFIFNREKKTVLGSFRRQRFCQGIDNSQTMAIINRGATPRQCMFIHARRLEEMNIHRNLMFDPTGDDVGFCAEILQNGGELFNIPCLGYDFVDDAVNSVIRNDDNRRQLAAYEEQCLMQYEFGRHYMKKTFTFDDGSYKFCDIDWKAYHKMKGTSPRKIMLEELWN